MTALAIQGIGAVGAFGCGLSALERACETGEVAAASVAVDTAQGSVALPVYRASTEGLAEFFPRRALRRIDHFARLALLGACLALADAGILPEEARRRRLGLIVATGRGALATTFAFLDSFIDGGDAASSPTSFSSSVHNAAAAHVAMKLGLTGPSLTVCQFEMSVFSALHTARVWLDGGRVDAVLLGGVDEYCDVLGYCWQRLYGVPETCPQPLDFLRQSAVPGEGAAFFFLRSGLSGRYGRITGLIQGKTAAGPAWGESPRIVLGADGHRECGRIYKRLLPAGARVAAYASLYGSMPAAAAFDLAIAALAAGKGRLFPSPGAGRDATGTLPGGEPFGDRPLHVLKLGRDSDFGLATVAG